MPYVRKYRPRKPARKRVAFRAKPRANTRYVRKRRPTLRLSKGPFPRVMSTQLVYKNPSATITSTGINSYNYCQFNLNSMWDFDITNVLGNKQPLFFDQLVTIDGPYRRFKVNAWKTTIKFLNLTDKAMYCYYDPASTALTEADTILEVENRRGVISRLVTAQANAKPMCTISKFQTLKQVLPQSVNQSENFMGTHSANPATQVYGTLLWKTLDGSTSSFSVGIQVTHTFYCQLYDADSVQSS